MVLSRLLVCFEHDVELPTLPQKPNKCPRPDSTERLRGGRREPEPGPGGEGLAFCILLFVVFRFFIFFWGGEGGGLDALFEFRSFGISGFGGLGLLTDSRLLSNL